jgi:hypothetical protein
VNYGSNIDIERLNATFLGIQTQFQELSMALSEERRARQQTELQLQAHIQAIVLAEVMECKNMTGTIELALGEERRTRQLVQEQLSRLSMELAEERRERQLLQASLQAQQQGIQSELFSSLEQRLVEERSERQQVDSQLNAQLQAVINELGSIKTRLEAVESPPEDEMKVALRKVEQRGNLRVHHHTGHVTLIQPLAFHPRTTKDEPTAEFKDNNLADAICHDLAEVANIFNCPMIVEGHTKGGESDFWKTLANERARVVADRIVKFGALPNLVKPRGLPGKHGKNEVKTEIFMDIRNIAGHADP